MTVGPISLSAAVSAGSAKGSDMDLRQYLRVLRARWRIVLLCTAVALGASAAAAWTQTPKYAAHLKLFVSTKDGTDAAAALQGGQFGQQRVKSYADIVSSPGVVEGVRRQLGLGMSADAVASEISASAPLDTVLVNVTVTDVDPVRARDIANAVGSQFASLVRTLETPDGQDVSPVKVSVVAPAALPDAPVSPNKSLDLALGLLIGLALGIAGAVLRDTLDTTVNDRVEASELAGAPVLTVLREDDKIKNRPLIVKDESFSPWAEAFRQLRTNIRYLSLDSSVRSLVVTSGLPSEGKTTVAVNLAIALAQGGEQVILVDADLRRPQVAELMGLNPQVGLSNVLVNAAHLDNALQPWRDGLSLRVLTSGEVPPNPSEMLGSQRMKELRDALLQRATVVVFDSPPILPVTDAAILSNLTDGALLVVRAGKTKRDALTSSAEALRHVGAHVLGLALNRVPAPNRSDSYGYAGYYSTQTKTVDAPGSREQPHRRSPKIPAGRK
jgi:polysaccharide biosynthesis transport protein